METLDRGLVTHAEAQTVADGAGAADEPGTIGETIGRYVVVAEVGRGGMGRVLRAYDPKLQREVAIKLVHRAVLGATGEARLVAEARAMAKLSHPHVVAVYDVEPTAAGVALVMEFVAGQTLRAWLRPSRPDRPRRWPAIVRRFVEAGWGLAAAHAAGVLHRDFKPANVLVADDVVKVTDFGIAKLGDDRTHASTDSRTSVDDDPTDLPQTATGVVLGTPRYMAPEQHRGEALTAAADQFAFCVALWEALSGRPPYGGRGLAEAKAGGPPAWPGPRIPRTIVEALRRGLAPDPAARWPDMPALLAALTRARQRRRAGGWLVAGGLTVAAAGWAWSASGTDRDLCSGAAEALGPAWDDDRRASVQASVLAVDRSYTAATWTTVATTLDRYAADWAAMHREACEATTIRGDQSAGVMDLRMACLRRAAVDLDAVTTVLADADVDVLHHAAALTRELPALDRCADIEALRRGVEPPRPGDEQTVQDVRAALALANVEHHAGRYAVSKATVDAAEARLRAQGVDYLPVLAEVAIAKAIALEDTGRYLEAAASAKHGLTLASQAYQTESMWRAASVAAYLVGFRLDRPAEGMQFRALMLGLSEGDPPRRARTRATLGVLATRAGDFETARTELERAIELWEDASGDDATIQIHIANVHNDLGVMLAARGNLPEAEAEHVLALELLTRALPPGHPDFLGARANIAISRFMQRTLEDPVATFRDIMTDTETALGESHPQVADAGQNLGNALRNLGRFDEAEAVERRSIAILEDARGPDDPKVASLRMGLGLTLKAQGRHEEAAHELNRVLAIQREQLGPEHPELAHTYNNLGLVLLQQDHYPEARQYLQRTLELTASHAGPDHPRAATALANLGLISKSLGELDRAESEYQRALAILGARLPNEHPHIATVRGNLAQLRLEQGDIAGARELADQVWDATDGRVASPHDRASAAYLLADVILAGKDRAERARAHELARTAIVEFRRAGEPDKAAEVSAWLRERGVRPPPADAENAGPR